MKRSEKEETRKKILVVDDDVKLCELLVEYLESEGHGRHCQYGTGWTGKSAVR